MTSNKGNELKSNQRNILAVGFGDSTSFIHTFKEFGSNNCTFNKENVLGYTPKYAVVRTSEITPVDFTLFGEQLNFIDTPEQCKISLLYEALKSFNVVNIDAILIFVSDRFIDDNMNYEDFLRWMVNLPTERLIIIVTYETGTKNSIVTAMKLESQFMFMRMRMPPRENIFLFEETFYSHNTMTCFFNRLKYLFNLSPSTYQFTIDVPKLLEEIPELFCTLIEVLHQIDVLNNASEDENIQLLFIQRFRFTTNKQSIKEKTYSYCCNPCKCNPQQNNNIIYCTKLNLGVCTICSKSAAEHINTRCYLSSYNVEFKSDREDILRFEKQSILHLMATLYHFCKLHYGLMDACKNFKKAYWSVVKFHDVCSEDPIYKEVEETIKDYESKSQQSTPEEIVLVIEHFLEENWTSFRILSRYSIETNCKITFLPANPEVKLPQQEVKEQKLSSDREIANLKQQIEVLKKQMN